MAIERRQYPRVGTEIPATITTEGGKRFRAVVCNISRAGLQLACDREAVAVVVPGSTLSTPMEMVQVQVEFALAARGRSAANVRLSCKVLGTTRLAADSYRLSVQYLNVDAATFDLIDSFINAQLGT